MEFTFETTYDQKALTAMAKGLRVTMRGKKSKLVNCVITGLIILMALLRPTLPGHGEFLFDLWTFVMWLVAASMAVIILNEDKIDGWAAGKENLPGTKAVVATFREDGYTCKTEIASSEFQYVRILAVAELPDYFVLALSKNHAQVYEKRTLTGGTLEQFRTFLEERTGREIQKIK